jgi:hypothetical protein
LIVISARDTGRGPAADDSRAPAAAPQPTRLFVQLLIGAEPLAVVEPARETFRLLKLPTVGGDWIDRLYTTGGRFVWNGPGGTYAIDTDLRGEFQKLADTYFVPSAAEGRLWFISGHRPRQRTRERRLSAVEMTVRGRVTRRLALAKPCHGPIVEALADAFVCQARRTLLAVDPATRKTITRVRGLFPFAARGFTVAACEDRCDAIRMTDIRARRRWSIGLPAGYRPVVGYNDGAFSPDGAVLAIPAAAGDRNSSQPTGPPLRIALVDVRRGTARVIPGSRLARDYPKLTWSRSGELFFVAGHGRLMSYRLGSARAEPLSVKLPVRPVLDLAAT